jgi:hypothetical protein
VNDVRADRVSAATGVVFVLLVAIGLLVVIPTAPAFDSSPARIQQFYVSHRRAIQVGLFIASFGWAFFVWFLGSLASHLRRVEGRDGRLAGIVFGSGLIVAADFIVALAVLAAAAFRPAQTSAELVRTLNDLAFLLAVPAALVAAAFFAAIAMLSRKARALPVWLSGLAVLAAIGNGFSVGGVFDDTGVFSAGSGVLGFYVPLLSFLLWILLASIVLAARASHEKTAGAAT